VYCHLTSDCIHKSGPFSATVGHSCSKCTILPILLFWINGYFFIFSFMSVYQERLLEHSRRRSVLISGKGLAWYVTLTSAKHQSGWRISRPSDSPESRKKLSVGWLWVRGRSKSRKRFNRLSTWALPFLYAYCRVLRSPQRCAAMSFVQRFVSVSQLLSVVLCMLCFCFESAGRLTSTALSCLSGHLGLLVSLVH